MNENFPNNKFTSNSEDTEGVPADEEISLPNYADLKSKIDSINTAVQNNSLDTELADEQVAELESEIYRLENNALINMSTESEQESIEKNISDSNIEEDEARVEYLRLKHDFKAAEEDFYQKLESDYKSRSVVTRFFGLSRDLDDMDPVAQAAYDNYISTNSAYFKYAQESGRYQKIIERLNANPQLTEPVSINHAVADRHYLRAAEKRLALQTESFVPESLSKMKDSVVSWVSANKKRQIGVLLTGAVINLPGLAAGFVVNRVQSKIAENYEASSQSQVESTSSTIIQESEIDLDQMEDLFDSMEKAQREKTKVKAYSAGAAVGAGVVFPDAGLTSTLTDDASTTVVSETVTSRKISYDMFGNISTERSVTIYPADPTSQIVSNIEGEAAVEVIDLLSPEEPALVDEGSTFRQTIDRNTTDDAVISAIDKMHTIDQTDSVVVDQSVDDPVSHAIDTLTRSEEEADSYVAQHSISDTVPENRNSSFIDKMRHPQNTVSENVPVVETSLEGVEVDENTNEVSVGGLENQTEQGPIVYNQEIVNEAIHASRADILAERENLDLRSFSEMAHGYQPKISISLEQLITTPAENEHIFEHVYQEMLKAYKAGDINLPAQRMEYIFINETALYSFIEESAKELSNNSVSSWLGGSESLDLTTDQWKELGFSSGDPQTLVPGDKIHTGKLMKMILENAAEDVNAKFS